MNRLELRKLIREEIKALLQDEEEIEKDGDSKMYCGKCKKVQPVHDKRCAVCGSDKVFLYW